MKRLLRVAVATTLLVGAMSATHLSVPGRAVACSCIGPQPGAPVFTGDEDAVLIGTVGPGDGRGAYAFAVERWFKGGNAASVRVQSSMETLPDGSTAENTCGLRFEVGERLIMAAGWMNATTLLPNACAPHAAVATPEGQRLVAGASQAFGEGTVPDPPPDLRPGANAGPDLGLVAIALVTFVVGLTAAAVALSFSRRRDESSADPS
jgi:hypothetical protein